MAIDKHLSNGVQIELRDGVMIGPDVEIEAGACILHGCTLTGKTVVRRGAVIGPNSIIRNSEIGEGTVVEHSVVENAVVAPHGKVGPFKTVKD